MTRLKLKIYIFTIKHDNIANKGNYVYRMSSGAQLDKMRKNRVRSSVKLISNSNVHETRYSRI